MSFSSPLSFFESNKQPARRQPPRTSFRPRLEILESRVVPATLRVGASETYHSIQSAVVAAHPNDTILVDPGTYHEQVTIGAGKNGLKLESVRPLAAVIQAPAVLTGNGAIVEVNGAQNVKIDGFTITGPNNANPPDELYGVLVDNNGSATITDNHITKIENAPFSGAQEGIGVQVGNNFTNQSGSADIENNVIDNYQKGGVVIEHAGSKAEVEGNTVVGAGPTSVIAQNGIQVSDGANAEVSDNRVSGNVYTPAQTDPNAPFATGILLFNPGQAAVEGNTLFNNDAGVYALGATKPFIDGNDISRSTFDGIDLDGTTGAWVAFNNITRSGADGIALFDGSTNNTIEHNSSTHNGNDGVFIDLGSSGNRLLHNRFKGNQNLDAEDLTVGAGTAGTGNHWDDNSGKTDNKGGRLFDDNDHQGHDHDDDHQGHDHDDDHQGHDHDDEGDD